VSERAIYDEIEKKCEDNKLAVKKIVNKPCLVFHSDA
jgi:hypothetical protein